MSFEMSPIYQTTFHKRGFLNGVGYSHCEGTIAKIGGSQQGTVREQRYLRSMKLFHSAWFGVATSLETYLLWLQGTFGSVKF